MRRNLSDDAALRLSFGLIAKLVGKRSRTRCGVKLSHIMYQSPLRTSFFMFGEKAKCNAARDTTGLSIAEQY